jgi:hypothetical protein
MFPGGENQWVRDMLDEYVEEPFDKVMADPKVYIEPQGPMPFLVEGGSSLGGGILGAGGGKLLAQGAPSKILPLLKNPTGLRGLKGAKAGKRLGIGGAVVGGVGGLFAGDEVGKRFMNLIRGQGGREEQPDVAPFFNNE